MKKREKVVFTDQKQPLQSVFSLTNKKTQHAKLTYQQPHEISNI
jgi:hypothetical protein